jgi:16S rRNA processing protein RimM
MTQRGLESGWVCVAAVAGAHGIRGALKLRCFTERPEDVAAYGQLHDEHGNPLFAITIKAPCRGGLIVAAEGVSDRNAADALRGTALYVPRRMLPEPAVDEFYYADLEGLTALDAGGARLGVVRRMANFGAGDVIEIAGDDGRALTLPFDRQTIPTVDLNQGCVVVVPPVELVAEATP